MLQKSHNLKALLLLSLGLCACSEEQNTNPTTDTTAATTPDTSTPSDTPTPDDTNTNTNTNTDTHSATDTHTNPISLAFDTPWRDAPSLGATLTFQSIGNTGWYPSRRDPSSGSCDALSRDTCCMTQHNISSDALTPWDEDLIMTLRGPMRVKQFVAYQSDTNNHWQRAAVWDVRKPTETPGLAFASDTQSLPFTGTVGNTCLVDISTNIPFPCGPGSVPYCDANDPQFEGWSGSKMFILLASMPDINDPELADANHCTQDTTNNWHNAPWVGLSHGELVRAGKFGGCHCYAKNPDEWWEADGCGQFNVLEVVNDNNSFQNFGLFSSNLFGYGGYVGDGPCGTRCDLTNLPQNVDLIDTTAGEPATTAATAEPGRGPGAALRRPMHGDRYFIILLDIQTRSIQLAIIHPDAIPQNAASLLPHLPPSLDRTAIDALLNLRLPQ